MVKRIRSAVNGHSKIVGVSALLISAASLLGHSLYAKVNKVCDEFPPFKEATETWIKDHEAWTDTAYSSVVEANKATVKLIDDGLQAAAADRGDIKSTIHKKDENDREWRSLKQEWDAERWSEQRKRDAEQLEMLRELSRKLERKGE